MVSVFQLFDPIHEPRLARPDADALNALGRGMEGLSTEAEAIAETAQIQARAAHDHSARLLHTHSERLARQIRAAQALVQDLAQAQTGGQIIPQARAYLRDAAERGVLTLDALRKRGDIFLSHEAAGCPPVLVYAYELVMDGADLPHPSNYMLLKILPPEGVSIDPTKRPYIIIDPRAGHGPGIGGFKTDSQVGVGLRAGHPVYFVAFRRMPEADQYLSHVVRAEAAFVREVMRRHPEAAKPVTIGNCQGGWAALLLAATNPDLTGPIVVNGAPVAPWAGKVGANPMRYNAGVLGGSWVPMLLSDLGGGIFDGAHLVQNFEMLNPSRTLYRKYTDLFRDIDKGDQAFLDFEKWWGGFFLLNEAEIRWIVEQIFVGNRLVKNEARIEPGHPVDIKAIRAPIIAFASHGDNITPPQQALNWITEIFTDVQEIRIRGQRIVYMVHDQVGHLGIFVSSSIARREHSEMASTLQTIEALAPGLYEMMIEDVQEKDGRKHFTVSFAERSFDDIRALDDGIADERPFAAVARASELQAQIYDAWARPVLRTLVTGTGAELGRALHPQRLSRALMSSKNPAMGLVEQAAAGLLGGKRQKAAPDNPFLAAEALMVQATEQAIDYWRDLRDMSYEMLFHGVWGSPWARRFGRTHEARRKLQDPAELRSLPEVAQALMNIERGGFAEAVIRMLVLLAETRGAVRRDRLERSSQVLTQDEPFRSLGSDRRAMIIQEQTLIATFEPERAIETLAALLPDPDDRALAARVVRYVPGLMDEMSPKTLELLERFHLVLGLTPIAGDVTQDPLQKADLAEADLADLPETQVAENQVADSQPDDALAAAPVIAPVAAEPTAEPAAEITLPIAAKAPAPRRRAPAAKAATAKTTRARPKGPEGGV